MRWINISKSTIGKSIMLYIVEVANPLTAKYLTIYKRIYSECQLI